MLNNVNTKNYVTMSDEAYVCCGEVYHLVKSIKAFDVEIEVEKTFKKILRGGAAKEGAGWCMYLKTSDRSLWVKYHADAVSVCYQACCEVAAKYQDKSLDDFEPEAWAVEIGGDDLIKCLQVQVCGEIKKLAEQHARECIPELKREDRLYHKVSRDKKEKRLHFLKLLKEAESDDQKKSIKKKKVCITKKFTKYAKTRYMKSI